MNELYPENNYIFVSYAHKDVDKVLPLIEKLRESGFHVWYDQGIEAGTEWPEYIAESIEKCGVFLACISPASMQSNNCRNEINFALSLKKECLTVYLEDTKMTAGMQLQLGSLQALFKNRHKTDESFYQSLISANILQPLQRVPAPTEAQHTVQTISVAHPHVDEDKQNHRAQNKGKSDAFMPQILCFYAAVLAVDIFMMWIATKYIENGFLMILAAVIPSLLVAACSMPLVKKGLNKLSDADRKSAIGNFDVTFFFALLLSLVGDCFFIVCTTKIIFKILISLGVNIVRYFIVFLLLPTYKNKS